MMKSSPRSTPRSSGSASRSPRASVMSSPPWQAAQRLSRLQRQQHVNDIQHLLGWLASVAERQKLPLASLIRLPDEEIALEIAALQWERTLDLARSIYALTEKATRREEIERLARSEFATDRYAAQLVREWDESSRKRKRRR
jgi:hypothetical protein